VIGVDVGDVPANRPPSMASQVPTDPPLTVTVTDTRPLHLD
jgi:hypothetical protein